MTSKKDLIGAYVSLKESKQDPNCKIMRDDFLKYAATTRGQLTKHFGSWKDFKKEAGQAYIKTLTTNQRALLSEHEKSFDPNATADDCIDDLRDLQKSNWGKHITRNFYRHNGKLTSIVKKLPYPNFKKR